MRRRPEEGDRQIRTAVGRRWTNPILPVFPPLHEHFREWAIGHLPDRERVSYRRSYMSVAVFPGLEMSQLTSVNVMRSGARVFVPRI